MIYKSKGGNLSTQYCDNTLSCFPCDLKKITITFIKPGSECICVINLPFVGLFTDSYLHSTVRWTVKINNPMILINNTICD